MGGQFALILDPLARPRVKRFELNPPQSLSPENNCQPEQDDGDRHERRAGDISDQDEDDCDDGEDCCDAVIHSFPIVGLPEATV
jgi:hypothetical protein